MKPGTQDTVQCWSLLSCHHGIRCCLMHPKSWKPSLGPWLFEYTTLFFPAASAAGPSTLPRPKLLLSCHGDGRGGGIIPQGPDAQLTFGPYCRDPQTFIY